MTFYSPRDLSRRLRDARRARIRELAALGIPSPSAKAQTEAEFGMYDRLVVNERGWIHIEGLDLSLFPPARASRRRQAR